jgi:hypothetical protein
MNTADRNLQVELTEDVASFSTGPLALALTTRSVTSGTAGIWPLCAASASLIEFDDGSEVTNATNPSAR